MRFIPDTKNSPVVRTDFSDPAAWEVVCTAIQQPVGDFQAYVTFVDDPAFDGLDIAHVQASVPPESYRSFLFVVDRETLQNPEHPIVVLDLQGVPGRTFRVLPSAMWSVENNLSLANMDWEEFAEGVDADGVFRGFPD
jgi:uncharacterized protein DUF6924